MFKYAAFAFVLCASVPAFAQQPPTPQSQAMEQTILSQLNDVIGLRAQIISLQAELAKSKAASVEATKPEAPATEPK